MTGTSGLSAGDVLALTKNNDGLFSGEGFAGIIMLLIVAGLFTGNGFGFGNNSSGLTEEYIANQFTQRDLYNNNTNIMDTKYALGTEILNNRYTSQVADCNLSKEIMQNRYDNALQTQTILANQNECCCNTQKLIMEENAKTRDLIQNNYIEGLRTALSDAKAEISNYNQSNAILNNLGRFHIYPSCGCGYSNCNNTII